MTDTSPENLRKFLASDDPALVRMGLSMAKGSGVPDEMLMEILWMYMFHDDKTIRAAAKSTFIKFAPEDAKQAVKENWKASYRTDSIGNGHRLGILGKALRQTSVSLIEQLIKALRDKDQGVRRDAAHALGVIGDARAVEPLIKALRDNDQGVRRGAAHALGVIGDARAVEPLIKALSDDHGNGRPVRKAVAEALGEIGKPAVEPLIGVLSDDDKTVRLRWIAVEALGDIGDERAVEPLIKALKDEEARVRVGAAMALGEIGDKRAVEPLLKALSDDDKLVRLNAAGALGKIGDVRAVEPLIKALEDDDESRGTYSVSDGGSARFGSSGYSSELSPYPSLSVVRAAVVVALGEIGDARAMEPLIKALEDDDWYVRDCATRTLKKLGHSFAFLY